MNMEVEFLEVNVCIVCLVEKSNLLAVHFDETLDSCFGPILVKHLWFQPEELHFKYVCEECWDQVNQFHNFYITAEKAHADMKLSTVPSDLKEVVKTESYPTEAQSTYLLEVEEADCVSPKQEGSEDLDQKVDVVLEVEAEDEELSDFLQNESMSESECSDDDSDSESPKPRSSKVRKKQRTKKPGTIEKIYHKSIEQIEEEDRNVDEHCKLSCTDCGTFFAKFIDYKQHFRNVHQEPRPVVVCCGRKFNKRVRLVEHVTKHMNPDAFRCTVCDKSYCNSTNLNIHMLKHGSPQALVHKCDQCERSFAKKYQLNAHMLQHVPEEQRKCVCPDCNKAFASKYSMQQHVNRVHLKQFHFFCDTCAKTFFSKQSLLVHEKTHSEIVPAEKVQCPDCGSWHKHMQALLKHKKRHHEHGQKQFVCADCGKVAPSMSALQSHRKYIHQMAPIHECNICGKSFKRPVALKEHMAQHTGQSLYQCTYCDRQFNSSANMFAHRKREHRQQWEENQKRNVKNEFATASLLNAHVKSKHLPSETYICEVCAKNFKSRYQFEKHRQEHNESYQEIRLQCKICFKWMKNASSLRKHVLRHDGEGGKHECEYCGKSAPNVLALQSHISFVHKKDKLFQCTLCPKAFKRQFTLIEHMTTHTGEVLYQCPFCSKTFNSSANMHAHKKRTHPQEWEKSKRISELPFAGVTNPSDSLDL